MHDAALVFFSAIGIALCLLPLPMQWRARNTGTLLNIFWNLIGNLLWFLNAVIWWNRVDDRAPVFCDFSVKLQTALAPGLTAASLSINRRLALIAMSRAVSANPRSRRLNLAIDLSLGLGFPVIIMALSYIVQAHRYDIFEGLGCEVAIYVSKPALFIIFLPPIILGIISTIYGGIAVAFFLSRRLQFNALLKSSQSGLDTHQYIRLVSLASLDLFISLPLSIFFLANAAPTLAVRTWPGFADVHYNWHRIDYIDTATSEQLPTKVLVSKVLGRWVCPVFAIVFFIFFGASRDAIAEYARYYAWVAKRLRAIGGSEQLPYVMPHPLDEKKQHLTPRVSFIPKLGSAVAEPLGGDWVSSKQRELPDLESGRVSPLPEAHPSTSSMSIVVRVERDTI